MQPLTIEYVFDFGDNPLTFTLELDPLRIELLEKPGRDIPSWARLSFHPCPNCPLDPKVHLYCPLTLHLVKIVRKFEPMLSHDHVNLRVITDQRTTYQQTTVQRAVSSLMGLISAASGCPRTAFFRPMARFHLPLADEAETIYRTTSMYMLAQYFLKQEGKKHDFSLGKLMDIYHHLQLVNAAMSTRLRAASKTDSVVNALILLDLFTKAIPYAIEESLEEIRHLFQPFLRAAKPR